MSFDHKDFTDALVEAVAAERAGQSHGVVGRMLRDHVPLLRREAIIHSDRGDKAAKRMARGVDDIIRPLFKLAPPAAGGVAVCAVGGYGRGEMAPFSDIDILFLHRDAKEDELRTVMDFLLYPLWDSGMKIGHGVHTPKSAVKFAREDMVGRTAYLDIRFLCGARSVFEEFCYGYDKLRRSTINKFVATKLAEQDERQTRTGETRYLIEPDIKEGKGALRDIQTIRWLYKYVYGAAIGESLEIDRILDVSERRALARAERFFWTVRVHLHDLRGRADEKLAFDIQPKIAERLNYAARSNMTAAERLMKHYFVNTVEVGRLTRILCAKLEEERAKGTPRLPTLMPAALQKDEAPGKPNLRIRNGRLDFESAAHARRQPRDFFRLFRAYSKKPKLDFHPDALALITEEVPKVTTPVRNDPVIAELFAGILTKAADPARVLRIMIETGLLGKYIPAIGSIVGRIEYGLYRRYTLDEHVLRSIDVLTRMRRGELAQDHPISTEIVKKTKQPLVYFLAVLLFEARWSIKDMSRTKTERLVQRITRRLGLDDEQAALAAWGAAHRSLLKRTAERRNLTEARSISTFARTVGSREKLDLMLVLCVCHLRVVRLNSWDEVMRRQLTELYEAAMAWFDGGEEAVHQRLAARAGLAREEAKTRLADWSDAEKEKFLGCMSDAMLRSVDTDILLRFAYLARAAENDRANAAVTVTPQEAGVEAIIYADDRPGLLADLAGAVAASGLSVRAVHALTSEDGKALDVFVIQPEEGAESIDANQEGRLHGHLLAAARARPDAPPTLKRRFGDRRPIFSVEPVVRIDLEASADATVVEAEGLDRPGLLYDLASALSDLSLSIASAHVSTFGERAVDAFYLRGPEGEKIADAKMLKRIEKRLLEVLSAGSAP